jgi:hypothetical protein
MLSRLFFIGFRKSYFFHKKGENKNTPCLCIDSKLDPQIFKFCAKNFRCKLLKNPGAPLANRSAPGFFSSTRYCLFLRLDRKR